MIALWLLMACGPSSSSSSEGPAAPEAIGFAECAVCGMVVGEQAAPRGQVQHRDGTHAHFCSVGDMRAYVQATGPRGKPVATWVEAVEAGYDPTVHHTEARPWIAAEEAHFVVGFERPRVMGRPALSFEAAAPAAEAAERVEGKVVTWESLLTTPFSSDP